MAGETQIPTNYNDISSGKVVNKEGLLELSVKIKEYVAENASSGSSSSSSGSMPKVVIGNQDYGVGAGPYTFTNYQDNIKTALINEIGSLWDTTNHTFPNSVFEKIYVYNIDSNKTNEPDITRFEITIEPTQYYIGYYGTYSYLVIVKGYSPPRRMGFPGQFDGSFSSSSGASSLVSTIPIYLIYTTESPWTGWTFSTGSTNGSTDQYKPYFYETNLPTPSISTPNVPYILINTPTKSGTLIRYWKAKWDRMDNYIPVSSSTDGTYMLVDTVSNGTSTKSWETVPSGGTSLPTDPSNDGSYVLQNTISSGSSTLSWTTPSSGGTTYTAGTGISITNGVISLDLQNANGVSY